MKKLLLLCIPLMFLFSCEEETVCADCTEVNFGSIADTFCGTQSAVDDYVDIMTTYDPVYPNQDWVCSTY